MEVLGILAQGEQLNVLEYLRKLFTGHWQHYALAFVVIFFTFVLRRFMADFVVARLAKLSKTTKTDFDDLLLEALKKPVAFAIVVVGVWLAVRALGSDMGEPAVSAITAETAGFMGKIISIAWIVVFSWLGLNLCDVVGQAIGKLTARTETKLDDMLVPIVRRTLKMFVGLIAFILIVQNLGYSIGALLAGFSVGGVALALASQDTLQNFFGSVMIFVDRPFQVDDWIRVNDIEGVVEEVGFRSTRIRTFAKTMITVPNSKIAHEPINNFSRMPKRRIVQNIGIGYDTEAERVEAAVNAFRKILKEDPRVDQEFWMVNFNDFDASALNLYVYYFTTTTVWAEYMQARQEINLKFMRALEMLGIEIAFPTRTINMREGSLMEKPALDDIVPVLCPEGALMPAPASADGDDDG